MTQLKAKQFPDFEYQLKVLRHLVSNYPMPREIDGVMPNSPEARNIYYLHEQGYISLDVKVPDGYYYFYHYYEFMFERNDEKYPTYASITKDGISLLNNDTDLFDYVMDKKALGIIHDLEMVHNHD